jgi:hypothetical protein
VAWINARADTKVTSEFMAELKRVPGKEIIPFKMTEAALRSPGSEWRTPSTRRCLAGTRR